MAEELVTLASIGNGAAMELFDRELVSVIRNISDVNTSQKTKRSITIKVDIQPDDERNIGFATVYFGKKDGKLVAVTNNFIQPSLLDENKSNVMPIHAVGKE